MLVEWPPIGSNRLIHSSKARASDQQSYPSTVGYFSPSKPFRKSSNSSKSADAAPRKYLKRSRTQEDADNQEHVQRKKRRLRLDLVTSRLSKPYATPTTHIVGSTHPRVGVWARQKFSGGKLLRKAATLNSIAMKRKREIEKVEMRGPTNLVLSRETSNHSGLEMDTSEYDEFDREDNNLDYDGDDTDEEVDEDNGIDGSQSIYSDFNMLDSSDSASEFCDASYSFDSLNTGYQYAVDPGGKAIDLVMENERHDEVSIAPAGSGFSGRFLPSAVIGV